MVLAATARATCEVGRLGTITLTPGWYLYVGSAFGPGGVRARVMRHLRRDKPRHWHLDYLEAVLAPREVWYTHAARRYEHVLATALDTLGGVRPVAGFGCSDCACSAHLFASRARLRASRLARHAGVSLEVWSPPLDARAADRLQ